MNARDRSGLIDACSRRIDYLRVSVTVTGTFAAATACRSCIATLHPVPTACCAPPLDD